MTRLKCISGLILVLLLSSVAIVAPSQAQADPGAAVWSRYPVPEEGESGYWVLASDGITEETGVTAICAAFDGTIYAGTEEILGSSFDGYDLFKSTDDGYTWTPLWEIPSSDKPADADIDSKIIALVLPDWECSDILYLATQYNVYKSTDGGEKFTTIGGRPAYGSGTTSDNSCLITSFDIISYLGDYLLVVSSSDADAGDYGGAYICDESTSFTSWSDLRVGGDAGTKYDVLAVAFPPDFSDEQQIVAVVTDEVDTIVATRLGISDWGADIGDAVISGLAATGGSLAFPADYDSDVSEDRYIQYVGLDVGGVAGGLYIITGAETPYDSLAIPVFFPAPVYSLASAGEAYGTEVMVGEGFDPTMVGIFTPPVVVAGLTNGGVVSISTGIAYTPPAAPPAINACVALGAFHGEGYFVYAGTSGVNGGFARSVDTGATFARTGLICDKLVSVTDMAVSPIYDIDDTVYMITEGQSNSSVLWRTIDNGETWDAVLTEGQFIALTQSSVTQMPSFDKVALSPNFTSDTTVFVCESGNNPNIWRSSDNGFKFSPLLKKKGIEGSITSWAIINTKTILAGDSFGKFYKTISKGDSWSSAVAVTADGASLYSIALSPDYNNDGTILAGDNIGRVYLSDDNGSTWSELEDSNMSSNIITAFDPDYTNNATVYSTDSDGGVYRYIIGKSTAWVRIDDIDGAPSIGKASVDRGTGLDVSPGGILYATDSSDTGEGISRCLNPTGDVLSDTEYPYFERVSRTAGGSLTKELDGLWVASDSVVSLWSIFDGDEIYYLEDTLAAAIALISPLDEASSERMSSVTFSWEGVAGAEEYEIWINTSDDFEGNIVLRTTTTDTTYSLTDIEPAYRGLPLYWKVRVYQQEPMLSTWSNVWSFTLALGGAQWSPFTTPDGVTPLPGATNVSVRPAFQWNAADWATGYELMLARDSGFADVIAVRTGDNDLSIPAWSCDCKLDYSTTYFWKVRAISRNSYSEWGVGVFTTAAEQLTLAPVVVTPSAPLAPPTALPSTTPVYIWVIIGIGAALIIIVIILIIKSKDIF